MARGNIELLDPSAVSDKYKGVCITPKCYLLLQQASPYSPEPGAMALSNRNYEGAQIKSQLQLPKLCPISHLWDLPPTSGRCSCASLMLQEWYNYSWCPQYGPPDF